MNPIKFKKIRIDNIEILFKEGANYIIGNSDTGKTTIFNCMRYVLGLTKELKHKNINQVEISISVKNQAMTFSRENDSPALTISTNDKVERYRALSTELNNFFNEILEPNFLYESAVESSLKILDFCFLPEAFQINRKANWDAVRLICGFNISMLASVEKDITTLGSEVLKNRQIENAVNAFTKKLIEDSKNQNTSDLELIIGNTKQNFFEEHRSKEDLLFNVTMKLEEFKTKSNSQLTKKLSEFERSYLNLMSLAGINDQDFSTIEQLIIERKSSHGMERISKLILSLAIAHVSGDNQKNYNHPMFLINDHTSSGVFPSFNHTLRPTIVEAISRTPELQYIEFTYNENISLSDVVIDLNKEGF